MPESVHRLRTAFPAFDMRSPLPLPRAARAGRHAWLLPLCLTGCRTLQPDPKPPAAGIDRPTFALLDTDADGRVSPQEMAVHKHEEGLAEIDLDNDKRISPPEWKAARPSAPANDPAFAHLDLNRDGHLSGDEAVADLVAQPAYAAAFRKMDANGDGHLHWEEYAAGDPASLDITLFGPTPDRVGSPTGPVPDRAGTTLNSPPRSPTDPARR